MGATGVGGGEASGAPAWDVGRGMSMVLVQKSFSEGVCGVRRREGAGRLPWAKKIDFSAGASVATAVEAAAEVAEDGAGLGEGRALGGGRGGSEGGVEDTGAIGAGGARGGHGWGRGLLSFLLLKKAAHLPAVGEGLGCGRV